MEWVLSRGNCDSCGGKGSEGKGGAADAAGYGLLTQAGCVEGLWEKVLKIDWPTGPEGSQV